MPDVLTDFILKPAGPIAAGAILGGAIWGAFRGIESVLTEDTKLEIALWLLDRKPLAPLKRHWPDTFNTLFERLFGKRQLSWRCLLRSAIATLCVFFGYLLAADPPNLLPRLPHFLLRLVTDISTVHIFSLAVAAVGLVLWDYCSLFQTRVFLRLLRCFKNVAATGTILIADVLVSLTFAVMGLLFVGSGVLAVDRYQLAFGSILLLDHVPEILHTYVLVLRLHDLTWHGLTSPIVFPLHPKDNDVNFGGSFFISSLGTSIWLWLYAASGFLLKAAHRFDLGFAWFNRHFDIEHKPLSAIGLVAGAIVAVMWWGVALVRWLA